MKTRAGELGVDWDAEVAALAGARDWGAALLDATDTAVTTPDYYRAGPCLAFGIFQGYFEWGQGHNSSN